MGTRRITSRLVIALGVVWAMAFMMATTAWASYAFIEISIPVDTVIHAPEDSTTQLATAEVPSDFVGHFCAVRAHAENQKSKHPGNDLVVRSGDSQVLLSNVEAEPGQVIETEDLLELGEVITVSLVMGPDAVFSAGIDVIVECLAEETTTTAEVSPTEESTSTTAEVSDTEVTSTAPSSESIKDEVKGAEVLPFTGPGASRWGLLSIALMAGGVLLVASTRRTDN